MLCRVSDWLVVNVSGCVFDWLVVNVSHSVLHWFQFGVGSVVGVACLWVVMVRTLVVVVCDVSIQRGHHRLVMLVGALVLRAVVVELNVRLDSVAAMHIFLMMSVLHWVHDLVMVVWCLMMDIVVHFMDMGWLVVGDVVIMVYHLMVGWLNMMHVHIMVIKVLMVVVVVEAVIRVEVVVASLSEVVELV